MSFVILVSGFSSLAITNTIIGVSGTNLVLSWPSHGYESYLLEYRHTLETEDSWSTLTNAFHANSTNLSTFFVVAEPPTDGGTNSGGGGGGGPMPPGGTNSSGGSGHILIPGTGFYRVSHIPNWLVSITNHAFDGPTFIPVDFASPDAPADYVDDSTVLINGQPTDAATFIPYVSGGVTNWGMGIYFDRLANGTNTIQLLTTVRQSDTLNDQTPSVVFSNAPAKIIIGNFVNYTDWNDLILSNTYTFKAHCKCTNIGWGIYIYDAYGNFVNYQTNHSSDGNISWTWDFTDYNGNSRSYPDADPFFYPYLNIITNSVDPSGWMPPLAAQYPDEGAWLFAYMDNFYTDGSTNYLGANSYYFPALQNLMGGPLLWGTVTYTAPIKYGYAYTQAERNDSWASLKNDLQSWNARNFYYSGHGSPTTIGGDVNELDSSNNITGSKHLPGSKTSLTSGWVKNNVTANKSYGAIPFRFVFLDGCDTAAGDWPQAWGVPKQVETLDYYQSTNNISHARPSAFIGWDVEVGGNGWGTVNKFWDFRSNWMAIWSVQSYGGNPASLNDAFETARSISGWVPNQVNAHLKKYGYTDMTFRQYNRAGDWP